MNSYFLYDMLYQYNQNPLQLPKINNIIVHLSFSPIKINSFSLKVFLLAFELITGQKPQLIRAKQSVAIFKLRKGMIVGCKVTLRKEKIDFFLHKIVNCILSNKNFIGISAQSISKTGNLILGVKNFLMFSEINSQYERFKNLKGFDCILNISDSFDNTQIVLHNYNLPIINKNN